MNTPKPIRIWFSDFWDGFNNYDNYFTRILQNHFNIIVDPNPDFLVHSVYGKDFFKYNCFRICYTGENTRPDFIHSDFHIGFDFNDSPLYLRWPLFLLYYKQDSVLNIKNIDKLISEKTGFCSFVVSNDRAKERISFFEELSKYKNIDSGGKVLNNLGYRIKNKLEFIKERKFCIAFENSSALGYTTEKIWEPFLVKSIPIYWGNPKVDVDFNPRAFINVHQYNSNKELIEHILEIDNNPSLFREYIEQPCFRNDKLPKQFETQNLISFFENIFSRTLKQKTVAKKIDYFEYINYTARKKIFKFKKRITKINLK
jgi:alpha(1,3/1,4) fucosyltransferase